MGLKTITGALLFANAAANNNAVGQLPVMGWSGYNAFMQDSGHCDVAGASGYNETTFTESMDVLVSSGLRDLGYKYINADDCWIAENRTKDGKLAADSQRFPHGMAWLADQAHSRDLKLGLYAAASVETCRQFPGSQGYEEVDAATFAEWGADFAKLDSCGGVLANGTESWAEQYGKWSKALNASGRQMVFSCSWAVYFTICAAKHPPTLWQSACGTVPWQQGLIANECHMWRYGMDSRPTWGGGPSHPGSGGAGVGDIIEFASSVWADAWRSVSGVGAFLDPDFLSVGCPTDRTCEPPGTPLADLRASSDSPHERPPSDVEQRTQFSMWCVLAAPLIIGSDVRSLTPTALATLSNAAAIAINQDPLAAAPRLVPQAEGGQVHVWARQLYNGDIAVAIVNMGDTSTNVTLPLSSLVCASCPRRVTAVDVWATNSTTTVVGNLVATDVLPHETKLWRLTPAAAAGGGAGGAAVVVAADQNAQV